MPKRLIAITIIMVNFCTLTALLAQKFSINDNAVYTMKATYYHDRFVGRKTANGEIFSHDKFTCAHKRITLGAYVEVTNPKTHDQVILKVNDRCPYDGILDMTRTAMSALGINGTGRVQVRILGSEMLASATVGPTRNASPTAARLQKEIQNSSKKIDKKPSKKRQQKAKKQAKTTPAVTPAPTQKSDILLCIERSQRSAELHASILPPHYASKLEYVPAGNRIQVILRLNMTQSQLVPIIDELSSSHPRLTLVKHSPQQR